MAKPLYHYWPMLDRPRLERPNGARLAFWIAMG
jgi:hypothetical protein